MVMNKFKILLFSFILLLLSACSENNADKKWIVGTSGDNPPYEFVKDGNIVGFDIDLMEEIAKYLDKEIEFKNMEFHSLIAGLSTGNIDVAIAGLSVTEERKQQVDFSQAYFSSKIAILHRSENQFNNVRDITKDYVVGAQLGSTWNMIARDLATKNGFKVSCLVNNLMLVEELKTRRIDAIILEEVQAKKFVKNNATLNAFVADELSSVFAIAMPKGSEYKDDINTAIKILKENGTIKLLSEKWGFE